ncbi:MAG: hypothetical protein KF862_16685 [Chitinophagaceae bacterium]|nr:hypothetical protein [Chitinophagaceae bacterium]
MKYLSRTSVRKNIASLLLSVMFCETVLPVYGYQRSAVSYQSSAMGYQQSAMGYQPSAMGYGQSAAGYEPVAKALMPVANKAVKKTRQTMIGGPGQPEMSSFKSVNADNMVDLFTGDFSYTIPLLDVGGYPVNIHYNGGPAIDQEASWVGLGWNVNPGTVNRSMRGLPDDFNGLDSIKRIQSIRENKTVGVGVGGNVEIFGGVLRVGINQGVFNNTYNGWGVEYGVQATISSGKDSKGPLTASLGLNNNSQSGINISPSLSVQLAKQQSMVQATGSLSTNYNSRTGISGLQFGAQVSGSVKTSLKDNNGNQRYASVGSHSVNSSFISFAIPAYSPGIQMPFTSTNFSFDTKFGGEIWGVHPNVNISGYVSKQEIADEDTLQRLPAYGFLYYTNGKDDAGGLLDMNREKEVYFNQKSTPHIAIPQYTYDVYSISGEGTGGMFRPYRSEAGYIRDHQLQTKSKSDHLAIDVGIGAYFKGGTNFDETIATTRNSAWRSDVTPNLDFKTADTTFQPVYFRNPGEKTSNTLSYYHSVGGDSTVRIHLTDSPANVKAANELVAYYNNKPHRNISIAGPLVKQQRDKRTQVITYKTAGEAQSYGLDKKIQPVVENAIPIGTCPDTALENSLDRIDEIRKGHHISEVTVLNADGRRYIYGLPAYNVEQQDVTFAIDKETEASKVDRGIADYEAEKDNHAVTNKKGKDNFFTKDIMPPYAHSYLLTGLLSPDYVDITEDGITDDDLGDAVKFNYTMLYGKGKGYYRWRTPNEQNKVNYSEGLKTYSRDDKGTYMYGKKEVWYLNSISSKTMLAVFRISDKREDGLGITDENGGIDPAQKLRRLERIDLYSKPDLVKNGVNARPVKSVHFEYDYSLCRNTVNNSGNPVDKNGNAVSSGSSSNVNKNKGKLTLRKIWFSYNGNYKGVKNPYVFNYGQVEEGQPADKYNPEHNSKHYDRWGGYKHPSSNPSGLNNVDYPYAVQDSVKAAGYANAWNLTDIRLPSGGLMKISYEADDYAYVQNKRAMQLCKLAGFGATSSSSPGNFLYGDGGTDYEYVFIDVPEPVYSKSDIYRKYLEGVDKIFFKIAVEMPADRWGSGYEYVPTWVETDQGNYGVVAGNNTRIWIKLAKVDGKQPLTLAALQFMKLNIPSKAYPASEMGDNLSFSNLVTMLASALPEIQNIVKGFYEAAKTRGWCRKVLPDQSFVRLNTPVYKKYGGGYRVKRVEVFDNWKTMTNQREASYGQTYSYTTTKVITKDTLVSGVRKLKRDTLIISSGVASYEPFIGGEENPLREPIEYEEKLSVLAPTHYMYTEKPLGESFYPGAMVGYSKVRVRTIHSKAKSANGWQETEFFTTRDFPTRVEHTPLDGDSKKEYNPKLPNLLKLRAVRNLTISQGFKVELNDMNGKMKGQANYAENDPENAVHYTKNFYRVDDETAPAQHLNNTVWVADSLNGNVNRNGVIGLDIEIMTDMRQQHSKTFSQNHQTNIDVIPFFFGITLPIPSYFPIFHEEENTFRSAATVKIVQRYGILDSVVVVDKGSIVTTKNLVYDAETGDAVVSRTNNEFDDPVYQFSYPAHWAYSGMGAAYKNVDAVFAQKQVIGGKMTNADGSFFDVARFFESGDEIAIQRRRDLTAVTNVAGDCPRYTFSNTVNDTLLKIWAIDAAKGKEKNSGLFFIDENGKPYTGFIVSMRIIRSGKRNMLGAGAGNIVSLKNPVKEIAAGRYKIEIDSTLDIINASATSYKDLWQVEKSYYVKDSVVRVYKDFGPVTVEAATYLSRYDRWGSGTVEEDYIYESSGFVATSMDFLAKCSGIPSRHSRTAKTKSILKFDLDEIPVDAIITDAAITFTPKKPINFWKQNKAKRTCHGESKYGYDWATANTYYAGSYTSKLRRITAKWAPGNWSYTAITATTTNEVTIGNAPGNYANVVCTNLIQDYVSSNTPERYGLVFELNKTQESNNSDNEINFLSFGGIPQRNATGTWLGQQCKNIYTNQDTLNCSYNYPPPRLVISYRTYVDSLVKLCKENINDTATNPYRWGILGNWRAERAYTWYSDRKESDAGVPGTNIRVEGTLKQWTPYWQFSDSGLVAVADTLQWVWNAASSIYNKRGFEIENYDPLGRYNSGLYGYNQSLPAAVIQNSRYREALFDGFEDYGFRNQACIPLCENPREFDFVNGQPGVSIDSTQSHTGNYSVKINAGYQSLLTAPVSALDSLPYAFSAPIDSTPVYTTRVTGAGTGFTGTYTQSALQAQYFGGCPPMADVSVVRSETIANVQWGNITPIAGLCGYGPYTVQWAAKVQAKTTDLYTFYLKAIGGEVIFTVNAQQPRYNSATGEYEINVFLTAGQLYPLTIEYYHIRTSEGFGLKLEWSAASLNATHTREVIPTRFLYPFATVTAPPNSFETDISRYCIQAGNTKAERIIRPVFSPVTNKKIVVSAWMRMDGNDCFSAPVLTDALKVMFRQGGSVIQNTYLEKTGVRIEGWQRYEATVTVPEEAAEMQLSLQGTNGKTIYVDDIRVQPYNSSMKSFAYDRVSLRLMAELDENNYASFYEYDNDGTLIRVKKETVKGIQTIKETRSALIREQ